MQGNPGLLKAARSIVGGGNSNAPGAKIVQGLANRGAGHGHVTASRLRDAGLSILNLGLGRQTGPN